MANKDTHPLKSANDRDYDAWFRAKVREALEDTRPAVPSREVEAHFSRRRSVALSVAARRDRATEPGED